MNDLTTPPPGEFDDDGFSVASSSSRGHDFLRWKAGAGWSDRDGVAAPSPMLAVKVDEILPLVADDENAEGSSALRFSLGKNDHA